MLIYQHHPQFIAELEKFISKHCSGTTDSSQTIKHIENLLNTHFCKKSPMFTPKHLGLAPGFDGYPVYFLHMMIPNSGLSRTQQPKAYFFYNQSQLSFLCLGSHVDNYKDSKLRKVALERLTEMLEVLKMKK